MKEYKNSANRIIVALLSVVGFAIAYGICWLVNAEFKHMFAITMPFVVVAEISWILFGINSDLEEKRRKERAIARQKRKSLDYGNNVIYGFAEKERDKYFLFKVS
ncbi:MAG: hypothetical protein ACLUUN_02800 [Muribaculaceae bacterium]